MTRIFSLLSVVCLGSLLFVSCEQILSSTSDLGLTARGVAPAAKATGDVEIQWMGGNGSGAPAGEEKRAYAEIEWLDLAAGQPAGGVAEDRGLLRYSVFNADGTLHREIIAEVTGAAGTGVAVDSNSAAARFIGVVTYDSRTTSAGGGEGGGCEGETMAEGGNEGGGCSEGTEGGCSSGDEGGCSGSDNGGCAGGDEGGCSGGGEGGCSEGGGGGSGGPRHPPGNAPRVGQYVVAYVGDFGTPGASGDEISWRWFYAPGDPNAPENPPPIPALEFTAPVDPVHNPWAKLCKKPVLDGNLVVHNRRSN